jgi:hypothetical protein
MQEIEAKVREGVATAILARWESGRAMNKLKGDRKQLPKGTLAAWSEELTALGFATTLAASPPSAIAEASRVDAPRHILLPAHRRNTIGGGSRLGPTFKLGGEFSNESTHRE